MVPSPPLWAVLGDVLLCLGAGLLLGAVRDGATLAFGSGPVRCFVWDVLAFAAAAFVCCGFAAGASATGAARWYMAAAMGLGALCWRWCVSHAVHRALRGTVFVLVWPLRFAADYAVHPFKQWLLARIRKIRHARRHNAQDSCKKSGKKPRKQSEALINRSVKSWNQKVINIIGWIILPSIRIYKNLQELLLLN